jgi:hypothetical protein
MREAKRPCCLHALRRVCAPQDGGYSSWAARKLPRESADDEE